MQLLMGKLRRKNGSGFEPSRSCFWSIEALHQYRRCTPALLLAQHGIVVVFYTVVGAPREELGNGDPTVTQPRMRIVQHLLLFMAPWLAFDARFELVEPPFAALFPGTRQELRGNDRPSLG
jgi:hypothetical protein